MKVVHIISSFGPGGAELLIKDLAINTRKDILVEIWAVGKGEDKEFENRFKQELFSHNVACADIEKIPGREWLKAVARIRKLIKLRQPDVIHTHSELATFYCSLAKIGTGVKMAETVHNTVVTYPFLQKTLARASVSRFVAISDKCKDIIMHHINPGENKITKIYTGVNVRKFQQRKREIRPEVKELIIIGRLVEQKDHATLLRAFVILKDKLAREGLKPPILNIAGTGALKEELMELSGKLELQDYVKFLGVRSDIPDLLHENDIWIMSSKWEGLALSLLEAMASGIPIVATDVGSNSEVIENNINGSLVEKENPEMLAEAIYCLMKNPEKRRQYSENARIKVMDYSMQECLRKYTELHLSLMKKPQPVSLKGMKKVSA